MYTENKEPMEFFVQYHITCRCNLNCTHCYQKKYPSDDEISTDIIYKSLKEISEMILDWKNIYEESLIGVIQLTGGEPLARDDWQDIIDYCLDNSLNVILMTNGTLLTDKDASFLSKRNIKVQVSLDGLEDTHNNIRGYNCYNDTIRGIISLLKKGIDCSVNLTLMKSNINNINVVIEELKKLGVSKLGISRYLPSNNQDAQLLEIEELRHFSRTVLNIHNSIEIICRDPLINLPYFEENNIMRDYFTGCSIGFGGFCILHNGTIIPCSRLNIPIGNIKNDSLREVWASSDLLWKFREFNNLKGKCSDCQYQNCCRGCRAVAYKINGDYFSEDPQCWLPS